MPRLKLAKVLQVLRTTYGKPPEPVSRNPFHLILWEQVGYLVPDAKRSAAYRALKQRIGLTPAAILSASASELIAVAQLGGSIAASSRAARMRRSAELVVGRWDGNLARAYRLPLAEARRGLAQFPMIGEPGADRILAIGGGARLLPLDSNGLRVLQRLGLAPEARDYRRAYRAAQKAMEREAPATGPARSAAFHLLRQHGQELCRRSSPLCPQCPLRPICPTGSAGWIVR